MTRVIPSLQEKNTLLTRDSRHESDSSIPYLKESPLVTRAKVPSFWLRMEPAAEAEGSVQQEVRLNGASVERKR